MSHLQKQEQTCLAVMTLDVNDPGTGPTVDVTIGPAPGLGVAVGIFELSPDGKEFALGQTVSMTIRGNVSGLNSNLRNRLQLFLFDEPGNKFDSLDAICCPLKDDVVCTVELEHFSEYGFIVPLDSDGDGVANLWADEQDNCPDDFNPDQDSLSAPATAELIGTDVSTKNRFLSFSRNNPGRMLAVRVTFTELSPPFDLWNGSQMWVGPSSEVSEAGALVVPTKGFASFNAARLQCAPFYTDWSSLGTIHVFHEGIVPDGTYRVDVIDEACNAGIATSFSEPLLMSTAIWGDTVLNLAEVPPLPAEGFVNIVDALAVLARFSSVPTSIVKARADLEPACVDLKVNVSDVLSSLSGFVGLPYPFTPSAVDPCDSTCPNVLP